MSAEQNPLTETDPALRPGVGDETTDAFDLSSVPVEAAIPLENYRVIRKIGEGGMGVVYEAEQQSPRRRVALKIIRGGPLAGERAERLFQREIQALARLKHPGIASIYESGTTASGQYYFSMELVNGQNLDAYLRDQPTGGDPIRVRLAIFLRIAAAVNYAHQRGVIHRDLKPSNVLVSDKEVTSATLTTFEDVNEIKVLDFGLARITDPGEDGADMSLSTSIVGTTLFMSPEQVRGNPDEIDLRTDIYSLGVILYWMISGRVPCEVARIPMPEAARIICEDPPKPLTTSLTKSGKIDPDLKTIVFTALEKSPTRRYQSVAALAEDIRRFLSDQPIIARPPSTLYHLQKLVMRHRAAAVFSVVLLFVVLASSIGMFIQARRIQREAETSRRVSQFLVDIFRGNDPEQSPGRVPTVREVLEDGKRRASLELSGEPGIQSQLEYTIGTVYRSLGSYQDALAMLQASLDKRKRVNGESSFEAGEVYLALGDVQRLLGHYPEARKDADAAVRIYRDRLGNGDARTADAINGLALILADSNQFEQAGDLYREAIQILERTKGPESIEISTVLHNYSILNRRRGDLGAAEDLTRRALAIRRKTYPGGHPWLANSIQQLGTILAARGNYRQSEQLTREALEMRRKLFGPNSQPVVSSLAELASVLIDEGKPQESEDLYKTILELDRKRLGPNHPTVAIDLNNLASAVEAQQRFPEAENLYRDSYEIRLKVFGENSPQVGRVLNNLARTIAAEGRIPEAEKLYQQSIAIKMRVQGEHNFDTAETKVYLARLYAAHGKTREADGLFRTGVDDMIAKLPTNPRTGRAILARAQFYENTDRRRDADAGYRQAIGILESVLPAKDPAIAKATESYAKFRETDGHKLGK